jgi:hypothetical protein
MPIKFAGKQYHSFDLFVYSLLILFLAWFSSGLGTNLGDFIASFTSYNRNMEMTEDQSYHSRIRELLYLVRSQVENGNSDKVIKELETLIAKLPSACKDSGLTTDQLCYESILRLR